METDDQVIDVESLITSYKDDVDRGLNLRLDAWPPDFTQIHVHEVIGSMLARQATLAKEIASAPYLWNGHSSPIFLRAMADVYINISWLLINPLERCLKFISFGLGQAKLELEHRRAEMGDRQPTDEEAEFFKLSEGWIDFQRAAFLQDVELGSWSGLSVRQMAIEAECLDFYNYVYSPFSACAHSMWHHTARYNLIPCANPLHRFHQKPISAEAEPDFSYWLLAAKYWAKTLSTFDQKNDLNFDCSSAYDALYSKLAES